MKASLHQANLKNLPLTPLTAHARKEEYSQRRLLNVTQSLRHIHSVSTTGSGPADRMRKNSDVFCDRRLQLIIFTFQEKYSRCQRLLFNTHLNILVRLLSLSSTFLPLGDWGDYWRPYWVGRAGGKSGWG
ncbi:hypothetical protein C0Q70_16749 [Pomacea canaliculata]|uniref:Uncharacterized protein n=1 Tax=Pomacea canaliculata TaxID=400727 RepID=A0A2T7NQM4_POMCA|nr:hypothetical protein C0Q70_16749 [Pomacea canaliculata]